MNKKHAGEYTLKVMRTAGWYNDWLFSQIKPYLGKEIIEVGAGIGNFTELLSKKGRLTAVDVDKKYLNGLKRKFGKNVDIGYANIEDNIFFFKNKSFNNVICLNVLEHIEKDSDALSNMNKLLKPGGILVLLVPAHKLLYSKFDRQLGHLRRYTNEDIALKLRNAGYKIELIKYLNWWAAIGWFIFLKLTGKKKLPLDKVSIFDKLGRFLLWPEKFISAPFGLSVFVIAKK